MVIDLGKPLLANYRMREKEWQIQYEGLHDLRFTCGKYGHMEVKCSLTTTKTSNESGEGTSNVVNLGGDNTEQGEEQRSSFEP